MGRHRGGERLVLQHLAYTPTERRQGGKRRLREGGNPALNIRRTAVGPERALNRGEQLLPGCRRQRVW